MVHCTPIVSNNSCLPKRTLKPHLTPVNSNPGSLLTWANKKWNTLKKNEAEQPRGRRTRRRRRRRRKRRRRRNEKEAEVLMQFIVPLRLVTINFGLLCYFTFSMCFVTCFLCLHFWAHRRHFRSVLAARNAIIYRRMTRDACIWVRGWCWKTKLSQIDYCIYVGRTEHRLQHSCSKTAIAVPGSV